MLSVFNGIVANGTWRLEAQDSGSGDTGTLTSWSLRLTTTGVPQCQSCTPALAGEALNLRWPAGGKETMQWDAAPNATSYSLYRGVSADLPKLLNANADSCTRLPTASLDTGAVLTEKPATGAIYWYLVRGRNGVGEGSAGNATAGPRDQGSTGICP